MPCPRVTTLNYPLLIFKQHEKIIVIVKKHNKKKKKLVLSIHLRYTYNTVLQQSLVLLTEHLLKNDANSFSLLGYALVIILITW